MRDFHAGQLTRVVGGQGVSDRIGEWALGYGERALLVIGEHHARASGLLARLKGSLRASGVEFEVLEGIGPNPSVAAVDAGASLARAQRCDAVIAVGGGSVIDAAKAIATLAICQQTKSFSEHLSGLRSASFLVESALPVVAIPTMIGSGSETNGTSVVVDESTGRKLSAHSDLAAPRLALLDVDLVSEIPKELLGPGIMDAVCHAIEAGLSQGATIASDALAEQALRMLMRDAHRSADAALPKPDRYRALFSVWWASNLSGQALTLAGSLVTHPLAHPISAHFDARHGEVVAALEPAVLAALSLELEQGEHLERVASWLGVRGASDHDKALRGVISKFGRLSAALGVKRSIAQLGVSDAAVSVLVHDARASGSRGLQNTPGGEPSADLLLRMLDLARQIGPVTPAGQVLARAAQR